MSSYSLKHRYSIALLVILGLLAYGRSVMTPTIFADDWQTMIERTVGGTLQCPALKSTRFLELCWPLLQYRLVGLNIFAFHAAALVLTIVAALLIYALLAQLLPRSRIFVLTASMLFLVYPAKYLHGWATNSNIMFALSLFLASCLLLVRFWRGSSWREWLAGTALLVISLGVYEAQTGLVVAGSVTLFAISKDKSISRRVAILAPAIIAALFIIWRVLAQSILGFHAAYRVGNVSMYPPVLVERLILGYRNVFQWAWSAPVLRIFPQLATPGGHTHARATISLAIVVVIFILTIALVVKLKIFGRKFVDSAHPETRATLFQHQIIIGMAGLLAIGAAYVPLIAVHPPSVSFDTSRVNILASIGAAVVLSAGLGMIAVLLGHKRRQNTFVFVTLVIPFIVLGTLAQVVAQTDTEIGWRDQKSIWQQLFVLAPDLAPGTTVILKLPFYENHLGALPFTSWPGQVPSALRVLYGHEDLDGYYIYGDLENLNFTEDDSIEAWDGSIVPFDQALLLEYDRETDSLELITELKPGKSDRFQSTIVLCPDCILSRPTQYTGLRWLVQ